MVIDLPPSFFGGRVASRPFPGSFCFVWSLMGRGPIFFLLPVNG